MAWRGERVRKQRECFATFNGLDGHKQVGFPDMNIHRQRNESDMS